jgi:hypothetical protein
MQSNEEWWEEWRRHTTRTGLWGVIQIFLSRVENEHELPNIRARYLKKLYAREE